MERTKLFSAGDGDRVPVLRPLDPAPDVLLEHDGGSGPPQESNVTAGQEPANPLLDEQRRPQDLEKFIFVELACH